LSASKRFAELADPDKEETYRKKAIESYLAEIKQTPDKAQLYASLADLYIETENTSDLQFQNLLKARALEPKNSQRYLDLATYHHRGEQTDSATYYTRKALALGSDQTYYAYWLLAMQFSQATEAVYYDSAIYYAKKSIELSDNDEKGRGYYALALVHHKRGNFNLAIDELNKSTKAGFAKGAGYDNLLATWYLESGKLGPGKSAAQGALKSTDFRSKEWPRAYNILAMLAVAEKKYKDALYYLEKSSQSEFFDIRDIEKEPRFEALHQMPAYIALVENFKTEDK